MATQTDHHDKTIHDLYVAKLNYQRLRRHVGPSVCLDAGISPCHSSDEDETAAGHDRGNCGQFIWCKEPSDGSNWEFVECDEETKDGVVVDGALDVTPEPASITDMPFVKTYVAASACDAEHLCPGNRAWFCRPRLSGFDVDHLGM